MATDARSDLSRPTRPRALSPKRTSGVHDFFTTRSASSSSVDIARRTNRAPSTMARTARAELIVELFPVVGKLARRLFRHPKKRVSRARLFGTCRSSEGRGLYPVQYAQTVRVDFGREKIISNNSRCRRERRITVFPRFQLSSSGRTEKEQNKKIATG